MPTVNHERASIYYEIHGETGDPVLLITGLGGDAHYWERQLPAFAARHRTVLFDNRGAGRSDKPSGPYTIRLLAEDALAVLDAAQIGRAHVVGLSMGGMIAQDLALRHPERVGALVLAATYARPDPALAQTTQAGGVPMGAPGLPGSLSDLSASQLDPAAVAQFLLPLTLSAEFIERESVWLKAFLARSLAYGFSASAFLGQLAATMAHDSSAELGRLRAPTLVISGTADRLVAPRHSEELSALIPGSRLVWIAGGTHGFNVELADPFNEAVLGFLAQHPL